MGFQNFREEGKPMSGPRMIHGVLPMVKRIRNPFAAREDSHPAQMIDGLVDRIEQSGDILTLTVTISGMKRRLTFRTSPHVRAAPDEETAGIEGPTLEAE